MARTLEQILASTSEFLFPGELGHHPVTLGSRARDGDTPLHVLIWQGDVEGVRTLLAAGADVNAQGDMGYTPLRAAISQNNDEISAILLNAGARIELKTELDCR